MGKNPNSGGIENLPARNPKETHGTPRNAEIGELRLESGILGVRGQVFRFPFASHHLRRFRVFSAPSYGVGR